MKISRRNGTEKEIEHPGLVNGRVLRQNPLHLVDHPLAGGYVEHDDGKIGLEQGTYTPSKAKEFGLLDTPLQGVLFDSGSEQFSPRRRQLAEQHHVVVSGSPYTFPSESEKGALQNRLIHSDMPSELIDSLKGLTVLERARNPANPDWAGWYNYDKDTVHVHLRGKEPIPANTVIHELGHRADFRSHLAMDDESLAVPPFVQPNPRLEGIADAFPDRYLHRRTDMPTSTHISDTGYSTQYDGLVGTKGRQWTDTERAIYAAARAHFTNTGENPTIPGVINHVVKDNSDEYLHMMQRTSPHARKALMQLAPQIQDSPTSSLWGVASAASRRYLSDRKVGTQLSMLKEVSAVTDSTPDGPVSTYHHHPVGFIVDPSLLPGEAAVSAQEHADRITSNFPLPKGHALDEFTTTSLNRDLYDDPYADGVSHEQHAATVANELAAERHRRGFAQ